ncbi:MAG: BACON domain-containing protein [Bacteroidales bacterium]|nr:BACON domain-containing protein [Bacteroidales bacterium]
MKKHFLLGLTAVAAMCLFSCNKENVRPSESTQTITFTALTPDTKTHFGEKAGNAYPTLWTGNEQVAVSYNGGAKTTASVSGTGKSASISAETVVDGNAAEHKFMLASPAAAITSLDSDGDIYFTIPSVQTPGEGTCDEAAQIIYATASCTAEALNSNISLTFKHLTAYGNMSVVLPEGAGKVKEIKLMTAATGLTGSYGYIYSEIAPEAEESKLTLWTDKTTGIFFACAPADLNGENLVVTVTTDKGVYEKDIDLTGKNLSFKAGKVSKFTVTGFKPLVTESWNLVTDASTLKVGDELVIASNEKGVVAGNIIKDYLSEVTSTFSDDMSTIAELGQGAVVFTLGGEADAWTLSNSEGKLLGCTEAKKVAWAKGTTTWKISIDTSNDATIKSTNTANAKLLYNANNPRFTTYTSDPNAGMLLPQIYRRETTILDPSIPFLSITPGKYDTKIPAAGQTLTFTVMTNQAEWTVTSSDDANFAVAKAADGFTVTISKNTDAADRNATITVTAGELTKPIALTQSGVVSVKQYTLTINANNFNSNSYSDNNKDHTTAAVAKDGSKLDITWYSNQVMLNSKVMQWQKSNGAIYNKTDLGKIISITVNKTSGTFTTYYGTSQKPTKDTTVGGGYFQTKVGSDNTGKTSSIVIVFNK